MSDKELLETKVVAVLLASYYDIIRVKIMDSIPKAIMLKLVATMKQQMLGEVIGKLYRPEIVDELLNETEESAKQRRELNEAVGLMKGALASIQSLERTF
jgi:dynamin 1-like protein